jgi:hypothetical protein
MLFYILIITYWDSRLEAEAGDVMAASTPRVWHARNIFMKDI